MAKYLEFSITWIIHDMDSSSIQKEEGAQMTFFSFKIF